MQSPVDDKGHNLLQERLSRLLPHLLKNATHHGKRTAAPSHAHWVITGVGSSEAHARFLVYLIHTYSRATAEYRPLSAFVKNAPRNARHAGLVVFSQGLSPNAAIALQYHRDFAHTVLFTAPLATLQAETDVDRSHLIESLIQSHCATFVPVGEDTERGLLLRVVGPAAAYIAAIEWLHRTYPLGPKLISKTCLEACSQQAINIPLPLPAKDFLIHAQTKGILIIGAAPEIEYAQNLAYKLTEGLNIPHVLIQEALGFAHGPFQSIRGNPTHAPLVILLSHPEEKNKALMSRVQSLLVHCQTPILSLQTDLPEPYRILAYELTLNQWVLQIITAMGLNLHQWSGKGEDFPLYDLRSL